MERLFGLETEYAFSAFDADRNELDRGGALARMLQIAENELPHLPDGTLGGVFLQNGARLYVDYGHHPEFSTPECANPWDAVRYLHAGERLLTRLATELEKEPEVAETVMLRTNVDYFASGATWGAHESYMYLHPRPDLAAQMIPHLVSRIVYTGAGGFDSLAPCGACFTLSPRVWHLKHTVSDESTHSRGIFHTKNEPLAGSAYNRMHILCGESLCSEIANWLKVGVTAVVVALIDGGESPGDAVRPRNPLEAMRTFARDPTCRATVPLQKGSQVTALTIQRHYLELAEARLGESFMPPFAESVCREWRAMLERLEGAPDSVATTLDWAIKYALYTERARRRGTDWTSLETWSDVVRRLAAVIGIAPFMEGEVPMELITGGSSPARSLARRLARSLRAHGMSWDGLVPFLRLRHDLCEIDARFGQLGERGIFDALDRAGALAHRVPGVDDLEQAMEIPPAVGRARRRGELVRELAGDPSRYMCEWRAVWDCKESRRLDMSDPFAPAAEWGPLPQIEGEPIFPYILTRDGFIARARNHSTRPRRRRAAP